MKYSFTFCFLVAWAVCAGQIQETKPVEGVTVGQVKSLGYTHFELYYKVYDADTVYTILFRNEEFKSNTVYETISFKGNGGVLNSLYTILASFFTDENKKNKDYKKTFKLGEKNVVASNYRVLGGTSIMFYTDKGFFLITERELNKLFGLSK